MFNLFKRNKKPIPNWELMENYPKKDYYFIRLMPWGWMSEEQIFVSDINSPRIITMDPWPQVVYLNATGSKTIAKFAKWLAGKYEGNVPDTLIGDVIDLMETLSTKDPLIELSQEKKRLKTNLVNPISN